MEVFLAIIVLIQFMMFVFMLLLGAEQAKQLERIEIKLDQVRETVNVRDNHPPRVKEGGQ